MTTLLWSLSEERKDNLLHLKWMPQNGAHLHLHADGWLLPMAMDSLITSILKVRTMNGQFVL